MRQIASVRVLIVGLLACIGVTTPCFAQQEMQFETTELRTADEYNSLIRESEQLLAQEKLHEALLKLVEVVDTGDEAEAYFHEAEYFMGVALFRLGLYQSSYTYLRF